MFKKMTAFALAAALLTAPALAAQTPQFMVPEHNYDRVYPYSEGYAVAYNDTKPGSQLAMNYRYALLDWDGKEIIPPGEMAIESFYAGRSRIKEGKSIGFMDHSLQLVVPPIYGDMHENAVQYYRYYGGMALVDDWVEQMLIDKQGNVIYTGYDLVYNGMPYREKTYLTGRNTFLHDNDPAPQHFTGTVEKYLDPATNQWTNVPTEEGTSSQVSYVWSDEAMGYVPKIETSSYTIDYRTYIPALDGIYFFDVGEDPELSYYGSDVIDGMVRVKDRAGKWGIAKLDGTIVLPCEYDSIGYSAELNRLRTYNNTRFPATRDGRRVFIDIRGREYFPFMKQYDNDNLAQMYMEEGYFSLSFFDGSKKTVDFEGNEVEIPKYKEKALAEELGLEEGWEIYNLYEDQGSGLIRVWNKAELLVTYLDMEGNVVFEPMKFHPSMEAHQQFGDLVHPFSQGRAAFWRPDGKWVYLIHPDWVSQDAALSPCKVTVDGKAVDFNAYLMKNSNYFKLRDLAMALKGTPAEFSVEYELDSGVTYLQTGDTYAPVGGELSAGDGVPLKWAMPTHAGLYVNGQDPDLLGFTIGENNYYKLRDIAKLLNVSVTWDQASGTVAIDTGTAYQG